jgi:hypothetical protein
MPLRKLSEEIGNMQHLYLGARVLMFGSIHELFDEMDPYFAPFAMLVSIEGDAPSNEHLRAIEAVTASTNCLELSFVGAGSEELHDYADRMAEENGRTDLITTWHEDESIDDVAHYFLYVAGGAPELLLAIVDDDSPVRQAIEIAVESEIRK